jgi:hypothetical protein
MRDYEKKRASMGHELLAEIFAFWSIIKANITDEEVEYLYEPHPGQVMAMFLVLGICGSKDGQLDNRLVEILTGEGKSVLLAGVSCYLALVGYEVDCMCYSKLLSQRDYEDFMPLFSALEVDQFIYYGTFGEITERLFNSGENNLRENVKRIILENIDCGQNFIVRGFNCIKGMIVSPRKRILLIDEVDVFFAKDFFGKLYTPSAIIKSKVIEALASYVWDHRSTITYTELIKSDEFEACVK